MLEIIKVGTSKYGKVWVVGTAHYNGLDIIDIFNTNLTDEKILENQTEVKIKKFVISRNKAGVIKFYLDL